MNESERDVMLRQHLAMLLIGVQSGADADVLRLARAETHRLVGAVLACLRVHVLAPSGSCTTCELPECLLCKEISLALLPCSRTAVSPASAGLPPGAVRAVLLRALSRPHRSPSHDVNEEFPMFSWHDAGGLRHAIDLSVYPFPPRPGEQVTTLCGVEKTVTREDFPQLAEYKRYKKTCLACDTVWRKRANLAPRPVLTGS